MTDFTSSLKSRVSALAENARDLTLDFEAASGSRFFDNDDQTMKEVQTLLTSRLDREKLEALRRLVAVNPLPPSPASHVLGVLIEVNVARYGCFELLCFGRAVDCLSEPGNQEIGVYLFTSICREQS